MFTFQSTLDQVVKGSKQVLSYVQDKNLRSSLENVVEAQAEFATTVFNTNMDVAKQVVESGKKYDYSKPFAELASEFLTK